MEFDTKDNEYLLHEHQKLMNVDFLLLHAIYHDQNHHNNLDVKPLVFQYQKLNKIQQHDDKKYNNHNN